MARLGLIAVVILSIPAGLCGQQTSTIQTTVRLVTVDVSATDKKSIPVRGLTCDDFQLTDAHTAQTLQRCEEHHSAVEGAQAASTPVGGTQTNVFSNAVARPLPPALDIILIDFLDSPLNDQPKLTAEVRELLRASAPGHRVAIFAMGGRLTLVSGFTDDQALLDLATVRLPGAVSGLGQEAKTESLGVGPEQLIGVSGNKAAQMRNMGSGSGLSYNPVFTQSADVSTLTAMNNMYDAGVQQNKRDIVISALKDIAGYVKGLPGRKNIFWVTSTIPSSLNTVISGTPDWGEGFEGVLAEFASERISLFPIEASGVVSNSVSPAEVSGFGVAYNTKQVPGAATAAMDSEDTRRRTMDQMADSTGGHAFYGNNDLHELIENAMAVGGDYYTLTYKPSAVANDGRFHAFNIKTPRRGVQLSYRSGYLASAAAQPVMTTTQPGPAVKAADGSPAKAQGDTHSAPSPSAYAMVRGLPVATGVVFAVHVTPMAGALGKDPSDTSMQKPTTASPRRFAFDYRFNPDDLTWTQVGDTVSADIRLMLADYDNRNQIADSRDLPVHLEFKAQDFARLRESGAPLHQEVNLPGMGLFLRFGVEDTNTGRLGTLEVVIPSPGEVPHS